MATKLDHALKRELIIRKVPHMLTIDPQGLKLTVKGKRIGQELLWEDLVSGQAALAVALNASLQVESGRRKSKTSAARKKPPVPKKSAATKKSAGKATVIAFDVRRKKSRGD